MKIALLGPTGQIGQSILRALLTTTPYEVLQIAAPQSEETANSQTKEFTLEQQKRLSTAVVDLLSAQEEDLLPILNGIEVVVSALNGKALAAQKIVQEAAAEAGAKRFYPSEYGMHHVYRSDDEGDQMGYLHTTWNLKATANEECLHHPSILSGKMTYTLVGCGDFFNQPREETWCSWANPHPEKLDKYTIHIVGNPAAKIEFTHIDDLSDFIVETINHPEKASNKSLNVVSDRISYDEIAGLLEKYSGKKVEKKIYPIEIMHKVWRDPETEVPVEVKGKSVFPDDFWILVKGMQGSGRFVRPPGEVHNDLFPGVARRTFEWYLKDKLGEK